MRNGVAAQVLCAAFRAKWRKLAGAIVALLCLVTSRRAAAIGEEYYRIAVIESRDSPFYRPAVEGFEKGLRSRMALAGRRIQFDMAALSGAADADSKTLSQALAHRPDLILAVGTDATVGLFTVKPAAPVIFTMVLDPVALGVVRSLAVPGGDFSGSTMVVSPGKQLQELLQAVPSVQSVAVLFTDSDRGSLDFLDQATADARQLNVRIVAVAVKPGESTQQALAGLPAAGALWLIADPASTGPDALRATLAFANEKRIPVLGSSEGAVQAGALLALSANVTDLGDSAADMAAAVLSGSDSPSRMSVRGPARMELSVNLAAARRLGIALPDALVHLADSVVDR